MRFFPEGLVLFVDVMEDWFQKSVFLIVFKTKSGRMPVEIRRDG